MAYVPLGVRLLVEPMKMTVASDMRTDEPKIGTVPADERARREGRPGVSVVWAGLRTSIAQVKTSRTLEQALGALEPPDANEHAPDAADRANWWRAALGLDV